MYLGHTNEAVQFYRQASALAPRIFYVHLTLAAALALRGEVDEAKREVAEAVKLKPEVNSIARWREILATQGFDHPQLQAMREKTTFAGLHLAGFPEE